MIEADYPITFRHQDALTLGQHLRHHNSVVLIGMKRVGIGSFLRFFLNHPQVPTTYIKNGKQLFIPVDLNDLVERTLPSFWTLTLKRTCDSLAKPIPLPADQLKDPFLTLDALQKTLAAVSTTQIYPVLVFLRFDRLQADFTPEFFANLQSLKDITKRKLCYLFTSFRPLYQLSPRVFTRSSLTLFSRDMYLKPASKKDIAIILDNLKHRYDLNLNSKITNWLLDLCGGHTQYLQLALLKLRDTHELPPTKAALFSLLAEDEEVSLQSEELFTSLTPAEQDILLQVLASHTISSSDQTNARYLWDTGLLSPSNHLFNPLFEHYLQHLPNNHLATTDFSQKEHLLYTLLKLNPGKICDRDQIITAVWPDQKITGVTDWAIDRLVARVRSKLKLQNSPEKILTVRTRGYKLT